MSNEQTPAVLQPLSLSAFLDSIENKLGKLSAGQKEQALSVLEDLDEAKRRIAQAEEQGAWVKAEKAQFDSICASLKTGAGQFLRQLGGASELTAERARRNPPRENLWWYLDEIDAAARRRTVLKAVRSGAILLVVIAVIVLVYRLFLAPDPKLIAVVNAQQSADQYFGQNDLEKALAEVEKGLETVPDSPDLLIYKAAIYEATGRAAEAAGLFAKAKELLGDDENFTLARAQVYLMMHRPADAEAVLNDWIGVRPQSARAYLLLGQTYEDLGDQFKALESYEKSSELANQDQDSTTAAQARIKQAMLMQILGSSPVYITSTPDS